MRLAIGFRVGRFEIQKELGRGGMGLVYLARDHLDGSLAALKVLDSQRSSDPNALPRFVREAEIHLKLRHPHIAAYRASGVQDGLYYLAVEYIDGSSLAEVLRDPAAMNPSRAFQIFEDLLLALDFLHGHGVIHRDLKPQNVLLEAKTGRARLVDFGISSAQDLLLDTQPGELLGSHLYAAPEQNQGEPTDARSDLYSLGLLLYECLTGARWLQGSLFEALRLQRRGPPDLEADLPTASPDAIRILSGLLATDPGDRFGQAREVGELLRASPELLPFLPPQNPW